MRSPKARLETGCWPPRVSCSTSDGVHTVGIDTIIERAGVAKASLYNSFGSKDGLVRAYLEARHEARRAAPDSRDRAS